MIFSYDNLEWSILFPCLCFILSWFSIDLALLVRAGGGRRRRAAALRTIREYIYQNALQVYRAQQQPQQQAQNNNSNNNKHIKEVEVSLVIPTAMRLSTKAVQHRCVLLVGGDFARSPRMQYHASSCALSGLYDEVLLVGLDCGNKLSEEVAGSAAAAPERFRVPVAWLLEREQQALHPNTKKKSEQQKEQEEEEDEEEVVVGNSDKHIFNVRDRWQHRERYEAQGCLVSTRYLVAAATAAPPGCFQFLFPLASLYRLATLVYKVIAYGFIFSWLIVRSTAMRVNAHGQLIVTDMIMVQTPPAIPFLLLIKYFILPLIGLYNLAMYYFFIIPASIMLPAALCDIVEQCCVVNKLPSLAEEEKDNQNNTKNNQKKNSNNNSNSNKKQQKKSKRFSVFFPAVVVDWHNYGYTIMRDNKQPKFLVALYKFFEIYFNAGNMNVTVSQAMRRSLYEIGAVSVPATALTSTPFTSTTTTTPLQNNNISGNINSKPNDIIVLYDKAPSFFRPHSRQELLECVLQPLRLQQQQQEEEKTAQQQNNNNMNESKNSVWGIASPPQWVYEEAAELQQQQQQQNQQTPKKTESGEKEKTRQQEKKKQHNRKGLILVGSTSWTDEDDYTMLVDALEHIYERALHTQRYQTPPRNTNNNNNNETEINNNNQNHHNNHHHILKLWIIITGKGNSKSRFEQQILNSHFYQKQQQQAAAAANSSTNSTSSSSSSSFSDFITVSTVYLQSYQQYSILLGAADCGLCFHFSTSKLDLPMKAVDMIGCGLPVAAWYYPVLAELMSPNYIQQHMNNNNNNNSNKTNSSNNDSSSNNSHNAHFKIECERGYFFRHANDLEFLFSQWIQLATAERMAAQQKEYHRSGNPRLSMSILTDLFDMQERTRADRQMAMSWKENWNTTLRPRLAEYI